jgi:hypothetical protein
MIEAFKLYGEVAAFVYSQIKKELKCPTPKKEREVTL